MEKNYKISGMTCPACERNIEKSLRKSKKILSAKADFGSSIVTVIFRDVIDDQIIEDAVASAGYSVIGNGRKPGSTIALAGIGALVLLVLLNPPSSLPVFDKLGSAADYGTLLALGVVTSLHCIGMCGGINLAVNISSDTEKKYIPPLMYNLGRILSYAVTGAIVGAIGQAITPTGMFKGILAMLAGFFMVIMGLNQLGYLRKFTIKLPNIRRLFPKAKPGSGPFAVGLLNGLMPCGPLQAMQLYAMSTASPVKGAVSMMIFAIGTVPLMFAFGLSIRFMKNSMSRKILKLSGVFVIILGALALSRGAALSDIELPKLQVPKQQIAEGVVAEVLGDHQEVTVDVLGSAYAPIIVKKGIPVRFTLHADEGNLNGCNSAIIIPEYGIEQTLAIGDTTVEFTPEKIGEYKYTCWMGMITSKITVVE